MKFRNPQVVAKPLDTPEVEISEVPKSKKEPKEEPKKIENKQVEDVRAMVQNESLRQRKSVEEFTIEGMLLITWRVCCM